jgi:hypothetical protein
MCRSPLMVLVCLAVSCQAFATPAPAASDPPAAQPGEEGAETQSTAAPADGESTQTLAAPEQAPLFAAGSDILATSAYVWRGFVPGGFSVQPALWITVGRLTVSSWMSFANFDGPMTEHDLTIDYTTPVPHGDMSIGYVNYAFPGSSEGAHSQEVYVGYTHRSPFSPTLRVFHDLDVGSGTYVSGSLSYTFAVTSARLEFTPSAAIGYNHRQWVDASTWSDLNVGITVALPAILERMRVAPFLFRSQSLNRAEFPSRWYGGVGISLK